MPGGGGSPGAGAAWASVAAAGGVAGREGFLGESAAALWSESWRCDAADLKLGRTSLLFGISSVINNAAGRAFDPARRCK
ncbi:hypothetical protein PR202_gb14570 [Eleusine coracana subsp. coracana]|uniref:Uncharacterized protein n=1 Tax=Eleusine coracana subsp. coracana TaxID=191504 RepID=A0AAV5ETA1_ELECO|nr:hypothetical protein PR202_gb14570 [Eleusine coracana subsp. coracana]